MSSDEITQMCDFIIFAHGLKVKKREGTITGAEFQLLEEAECEIKKMIDRFWGGH